MRHGNIYLDSGSTTMALPVPYKHKGNRRD